MQKNFFPNGDFSIGRVASAIDLTAGVVATPQSVTPATGWTLTVLPTGGDFGQGLLNVNASSVSLFSRPDELLRTGPGLIVSVDDGGLGFFDGFFTGTVKLTRSIPNACAETLGKLVTIEFWTFAGNPDVLNLKLTRDLGDGLGTATLLNELVKLSAGWNKISRTFVNPVPGGTAPTVLVAADALFSLELTLHSNAVGYSFARIDDSVGIQLTGFSLSADITAVSDGVNKVTSPATTPKVYRALLTQTGTAAPVATVLENTLGGTVVWTRTLGGVYVATLAGAFTASKTALLHGDGITGAEFSIIYFSRTNGNVLQLVTQDVDVTGATLVIADAILSETFVQILVYP